VRILTHTDSDRRLTLSDAKPWGDWKTTTSGITLSGTTPLPFVYVSFTLHFPLCLVRLGLQSGLTQTDDILPFRNSVLAEYALLMAPKPVGLGLSESEIETVARMGMQSRFPNPMP
jgi:hypothetical protein